MEQTAAQAGGSEFPASERDWFFDYLDWCDYAKKYNRPLDVYSQIKRAYFESMGIDANPDNWTKHLHPDFAYRKYPYYYQHTLTDIIIE